MKTSIKKFLLQVVCAAGLTWPLLGEAVPWIEWDTPEGLSRTRIASSTHPGLWKMLRFYETQRALTYCGVTSAVIALNSLGIESPWTKLLGKYRIFNQEEFFSEVIEEIIPRKEVENRGVSMDKLAAVLRKFPLKVTAYQGKHLSHEQMRSLIVPALKDPNQRVLVLYHRQTVEQEGGGHWSPVIAYDVYTDSFLLLDVARYKNSPIWVEATPLLNAMQTQDFYEQLRGFIIIEKQEVTQI